jgi:hypothetical protein
VSPPSVSAPCRRSMARHLGIAAMELGLLHVSLKEHGHIQWRSQAPGNRGLGLGRGGKILSFTVAFYTVQHYLVL